MKSPPSCPALYKGASSGICSNPQAALSEVTEFRRSEKIDDIVVGFSMDVKISTNVEAKAELSELPTASRTG